MLFTQPQFPTQIHERLYIGNLPIGWDKEQLKKLEITHILICASLLDPLYPNDFIYKNIEVDDIPSVDIKKHFQECNMFIKEGMSIGKVFVYCAAGISRSTTCVIAFLMKEYEWNFDKAFKYLLDKHPITKPNIGFLKQLRIYESELSNKETISLFGYR